MATTCTFDFWDVFNKFVGFAITGGIFGAYDITESCVVTKAAVRVLGDVKGAINISAKCSYVFDIGR